jgi:hypothetical protein
MPVSNDHTPKNAVTIHLVPDKPLFGGKVDIVNFAHFELGRLQKAPNRNHRVARFQVSRSRFNQKRVKCKIVVAVDEMYIEAGTPGVFFQVLSGIGAAESTPDYDNFGLCVWSHFIYPLFALVVKQLYNLRKVSLYRVIKKGQSMAF